MGVVSSIFAWKFGFFLNLAMLWYKSERVSGAVSACSKTNSGPHLGNTI
jgi:hypothetical protein